MCKLLSNWLGGGVCRIMTVGHGIAALVGLTATAALAAPPNDNFANAIALPLNPGLSQITGTNVGATLEPGEPIDAGVGGGKTIWYVWTAPASETIEFDTEGSDFDTVLGVYTGSSVSNLTLVAQNDDVSFPSDLTSQVSFAATAGTNYYISIDGNEGDSGHVILNWRSTGAFSGGQFGFAAPGSAQDGTPTYTVTPWDTSGANFAPWMPNTYMYIRPVRTQGSAGKVLLTYSITNSFYTNLLQTNLWITNIVMNNSDGTFTNILIANYYSKNQFQQFYGNGFVTNTITNSFSIGITNANGTILPGTNNQTSPVTGYPFTGGPCDGSLITLAPGTVTNGNIITILTTNLLCTNFTVTNIIPSALPGKDYFPVVNQAIQLADFQLGTNIAYSVLPILNQFASTNVAVTNLTDRLVVVTLNSVSFDPLEDTNNLAP